MCQLLVFAVAVLPGGPAKDAFLEAQRFHAGDVVDVLSDNVDLSKFKGDLSHLKLIQLPGADHADANFQSLLSEDLPVSEQDTSLSADTSFAQAVTTVPDVPRVRVNNLPNYATMPATISAMTPSQFFATYAAPKVVVANPLYVGPAVVVA